MSRFEVEPTWGKRVWAALLAVVGISSLVFSTHLSSKVGAAVMLLAAWELAFLPQPPFNQTLGQIYRNARQGWRMSMTARIVNYVTFFLAALAIYLKVHGR